MKYCVIPKCRHRIYNKNHPEDVVCRGYKPFPRSIKNQEAWMRMCKLSPDQYKPYKYYLCSCHFKCCEEQPFSRHDHFPTRYTPEREPHPVSPRRRIYTSKKRGPKRFQNQQPSSLASPSLASPSSQASTSSVPTHSLDRSVNDQRDGNEASVGVQTSTTDKSVGMTTSARCGKTSKPMVMVPPDTTWEMITLSDGTWLLTPVVEAAEEEPSHLERLKSEGFALVHVSRLDELTEFCLHRADSGLCGQPITKKDKRTEGTALVWSLECASGHFRTWESQPRIQGGQQFLGNFLLAAAAVIAGLAQETVKRFFSLFGILSLGMAAFFKENESAIHHAVMDSYGIHEKEVSEKLKSNGQPVFLAGHSRYTGSNNKRSTSCCYSLQDLQSGLVTSFTVSNQKEDKCTTASDLETTARQSAFEKMKPVVEVLAFCPEQSLITHTLGRSFSERFSPADHHDLWRLVGKLNVRLIRMGRQKGMDQVKPWIGYALNHLLHSARTSNGSPGELVRKWTELAHHVANEHQWLGKDGKGQKCSHADLAGTHAQIPWLIQGSVVHEALCSLVLNEKLLEAMKGLSLVSHEARYDKFQSVVANYVPEVGLSEKAGLETRMALAVVDHNVRSMNGLNGYLKKSSQTAEHGDEWRHELIRKCLQLASN